ncbi:MAG TPA: sigma-70 family RNA polymerase sigma factor [Planctomycetota bacterium]|jgi:RNA polymerase sigma-70 factor (ECF subfamily)
MGEHTRLNDEVLMASFRLSADEKLFEELVSRHTQRALWIAKAMFGNETAAEDAVQECFLRLIRARHSYEPGRRFIAWFSTILNNICRDELLRRAHEPLPETGMVAAANGSPADASAEMHEEFRSAHAAFCELLVEDRRILLLRIHGGLEFSEIAAQCGLSLEATRKRAYRAMQRLRQRLASTRISGSNMETARKVCPEDSCLRSRFGDSQPAVSALAEEKKHE